jgi:imidazolonepropionase
MPPEFSEKGKYIKFLCDKVLPVLYDLKLVDAIDAYCEKIAFSAAEIEPLFEHANLLEIPIKIHADQLSDCRGAELAAQFGALSADHLEYTNTAGIKALAEAGTVAVLLPGAFLTLGEQKKPPIEQFRSHNIPIAIGSDCNPGTSPLCSLRYAMNLASTLFQLTPEECLSGVTREAARALNMIETRGTIEVGKQADIAVWDIGHPNELSYWLGLNQLSSLYVKGQEV